MYFTDEMNQQQPSSLVESRAYEACWALTGSTALSSWPTCTILGWLVPGYINLCENVNIHVVYGISKLNEQCKKGLCIVQRRPLQWYY